MILKHSTINRILTERFDWDYGLQYGEPGYSNDGVKFVVLGNYWVPKTNPLESWDQRYPRFFAKLEEMGYRLEWEDEWIIDWEDDGRVYRTEPDSYSWQTAWVWSDDDYMITPTSDPQDWVDWAINDHKRAITETGCPNIATYLSENGWTRVKGEFQSGWYDRDDRPEDIAARCEGDVVFVLDGVGQFAVDFVAWTKDVDTDEEGW